jgi:hypothetical protein
VRAAGPLHKHIRDISSRTEDASRAPLLVPCSPGSHAGRTQHGPKNAAGSGLGRTRFQRSERAPLHDRDLPGRQGPLHNFVSETDVRAMLRSPVYMNDHITTKRAFVIWNSVNIPRLVLGDGRLQFTTTYNMLNYTPIRSSANPNR